MTDIAVIILTKDEKLHIGRCLELIAALSPRQTEILQSIVRGLSNPDIAKQLGISVDMVKEHVESLFQKIGAANRTEAVAIAFRKHLLKM